MLWDVLIALTAIGLALAGWNVGLINSWRGPIAMILATILSQMFYIDFSTWIVQQLMIKPTYATLFGYLMLWLLIEIISEIVMSLFLTWNRKERPRVYDRIGGAVFGLIKWFCIFLFPLIAMQSPNKIPEPPPTTDNLVNPLKLQIDDSAAIRFFAQLGQGGMSFLSPIVVNKNPPSFKPNFDRPHVKLE